MEWIRNNLFNWSSGLEWLGLLAAALVLVSFLMKDERTIRLVNIIGATVFVVYGLLIHSGSVWLMNGALVVVHVIKLTKIKRNGNVDVQDEQATNTAECKSSDDERQ